MRGADGAEILEEGANREDANHDGASEDGTSEGGAGEQAQGRKHCSGCEHGRNELGRCHKGQIRQEWSSWDHRGIQDSTGNRF